VGTRLLLVEDNEMNQELALELLENAGIKVVLANNGQAALNVLAEDTAFDGILMDCQMPVMDGYTATREIRKNPIFREIPIIAMTANAMAGDKEKVVEAGMNDHIAKPLDVTQMFATISRWVKPSADHGEAVTESVQQSSGNGAPVELDMGKILPLLDQLAFQLADIDTEASDTVDELLALTQGTHLANGLRKVARAVADYEFDAAEEVLKSIVISQI
jgi:CheY-like chemotaxis protein